MDCIKLDYDFPTLEPCCVLQMSVIEDSSLSFTLCKNPRKCSFIREDGTIEQQNINRILLYNGDPTEQATKLVGSLFRSQIGDWVGSGFSGSVTHAMAINDTTKESVAFKLNVPRNIGTGSTVHLKLD